MAKANMKRIAKNAANYRQQGLSSKRAMQKAWEDEKGSSKSSSKKPSASTKKKSLLERFFG